MNKPEVEKTGKPKLRTPHSPIFIHPLLRGGKDRILDEIDVFWENIISDREVCRFCTGNVKRAWVAKTPLQLKSGSCSHRVLGAFNVPENDRTGTSQLLILRCN